MQNALSITILLVEDVEINRWLILQSFKNMPQFIMHEAENGKEAVEKIQQNVYDIILMDLHMPVMNGWEATQIIRSLPEEKYKQVPIIALTGDSEEQFYKKEEAMFFTDILPKPFDGSDIERKILQYAPTSRQSGVPEDSKSTKAESLFKGNRKREEMFYWQANENLLTFKGIFKEAMLHRDAEKLSDMRHKAILVIHVLALNDLEAILEKCQRNLLEEASQSELEQSLAEGEACFDQALTNLQERMQP